MQELLDRREEERRRLDCVTALGRVERERRGLALAVGSEAVDGVGGKDDEPSGSERGDRRADAVPGGHPGRPPPTTPLDDSLAAGEVARHRDVDVPVLAEERRDAGSTVLVRLQDECAAGTQGRARVPHQSLGLPAVDERDVGLPVDDVRRQGRDLAGMDVRRVRHDEVPAFTGKPREEIVAPELDLDPDALRVLTGEGERVLRDVDAGHSGPRVLVGDRKRDRARPRADVEHPRRVGAVEQRKAALDDRLGLGARNERPPVDGQREPPEAPLAEDVLQRLARRPPCDEGTRPFELVSGQGTVEVHVELDPVDSEDAPQQALGIEPRAFGPLPGEMLGRATQHVADRERGLDVRRQSDTCSSEPPLPTTNGCPTEVGRRTILTLRPPPRGRGDAPRPGGRP